MKMWPNASGFFKTLGMLSEVISDVQEALEVVEFDADDIDQIFSIKVSPEGLFLRVIELEYPLGGYTMTQLMALKNNPGAQINSILLGAITGAVVKTLANVLTDKSIVASMNEAIAKPFSVEATFAPKQVEGFSGADFKAKIQAAVGEHVSVKTAEADGVEKIKAGDLKVTPSDENMSFVQLSPQPPKAMMAQIPVPLREAKHMYQAVKGTSAGSRYFLVATNGDVRVAVKYQQVSMSVRVEASETLLKKLISKLNDAGLDYKGDYASSHFAVDSPVIAAKTLGAVLMALNVDFTTPMPKLELLHNVGS